MKRRYISTILLAAAVMMPAAAMAAGDAPAKTSRPAPSADRNPVDRTADASVMTFKALDANKDGSISKEEAKHSNELSKQFASLDKDGDGKLSAQELSGLNAPAAGRAEPQTAGRSKLPAAPRQAPGTMGSTEGGDTGNPARSGNVSR